MKNRLQLLIVLFVLIIFALPVGATGAPPILNSASSDCSQVIANIQEPQFNDIYLRVTSGGSPVSSELLVAGTTTPESKTVVIPLSSAQPDGTILQIEWRYDFSSLWTNFGPSFACVAPEKPVEPEEPGVNLRPWELFGGEDAYMAAQFTTDNTGTPTLILLSVDNDSNGTILTQINATMLEEGYPCTGETYVIFEADTGLHYLIRQGDCNLMMLVGPDFENKMHYVIIDGVPPTSAKPDTYFLGALDRQRFMTAFTAIVLN